LDEIADILARQQHIRVPKLHGQETHNADDWLMEKLRENAFSATFEGQQDDVEMLEQQRIAAEEAAAQPREREAGVEEEVPRLPMLDAEKSFFAPAEAQGDLLSGRAQSGEAFVQNLPEPPGDLHRMQREEDERRREEAERAAGKPYVDPFGEMRDAQGNVMFTGVPLRITALDDFFKGGAPTNAIARFFRKWFTAPGGLTQAAFEEKLKHDGRVEAYMQDIRDTAKDLRRVVKETGGGAYEKLSERQRATMLAALEGDQRALAALPELVQPIVRSMREQVDLLSRALVQNGAIEGPMATTVDENLGVYLHRSYQVFKDPAWASKVPADVRNRFKSWLRAERQAAGDPVTEDELEGTITALLVDGTAAENPIAFLSKSKLGSKDLSILTRRKAVPAELRALWGETTDPLVKYAESVAMMSHLLSNHIFLTNVREAGLKGGWFSEKPSAERNLVVQIAIEGSEVMKPLNGLYTTPDIKEAFEAVYRPQQMPQWLRWYMRVLAAPKYAQTVLSHVAQIRNVVSNVGFAIANGHWRVNKALPALKAFVDDTKEGRAYWRSAVEHGVVGQNIQANEVRELERDVLSQRADSAMDAIGMVTDRGIARAARSGLRTFEKLYHAGDAVWKLYAWENEKVRYRNAHPEWTQEQVAARAAEIVRNTYPTYSMISRGVKGVRRLPLVAPFISFTAEVVRTSGRTIQLAMQELKDPNMRGIGATRLAGIIAAGGMAYALQMMTRAMFGLDPDDEEAMRRFMPEWSRNSPIMHLGRNARGELRYLDLGYSDPYAYLKEPIIAALRGENPLESLAAPFISEELLTQRLVDVARNRQSNGREVYNPQASTGERSRAIAAHVGEPFIPGSYTSGRRVLMALLGKAEPTSGRMYDAADEIRANRTGQRLQQIDVGQSLGFHARASQRAESDAMRILSEVTRRRGMVSDQEIQEAHQEMETARRRIYEELHEDVLAARQLGMDEAAVRRILRSADYSVQDVNDVIQGRYRPWRPSDQFMRGYRGMMPAEELNRRRNVVRQSTQSTR
jgi:hypothetical protein